MGVPVSYAQRERARERYTPRNSETIRNDTGAFASTKGGEVFSISF